MRGPTGFPPICTARSRDGRFDSVRYGSVWHGPVYGAAPEQAVRFDRARGRCTARPGRAVRYGTEPARAVSG
ncbi:hypothetical protein GCM10018953_52440 [Streptosporangium nondiastaticum]